MIIFVPVGLDLAFLTKKQLSDLYLKKIDKIDGKKVVFIDNTDDYKEFCKKILNKTPSQVHAYWMKQIFLGKKIPPKKYGRSQVSEIIKNSKNVIVYSSKKLEGKTIFEAD